MGCVKGIGVLRYAQDDSKNSEQHLVRGFLEYALVGGGFVA